MKLMTLALLALTLSGCTSVGTVGIVTKSTANPTAIFKEAQSYKQIGQVSEESCRFFLLGVIPWGNGTFAQAADKALEKAGGDALINVTVMNSLYGFIPVYNLFSYTCTEITGTAIKFEKTTVENQHYDSLQNRAH